MKIHYITSPRTPRSPVLILFKTPQPYDMKDNNNYTQEDAEYAELGNH